MPGATTASDLLAALAGAMADPLTLIVSLGLALMARRWWAAPAAAAAMGLMAWALGMGGAAAAAGALVDGAAALGLLRLLRPRPGLSPPAA